MAQDKQTVHDPPAPAARATPAQLEQMAAEVRDNPLFQALLDWIDGYVVILNRQRQIVMVSEQLAEALGSKAERLIGCRPGEAVGCVHSAEEPGGCGTSAACRYCGALQAILASQRDNEPIQSECRISLGDDEGARSVKLSVRASKAGGNDSDYIVLVLRRAGSLVEPVSADEPVLDKEADWPPDPVPFAQVRKLGTGGMASVFLVRDDEDREFALKTMRRDFANNEELVARFLREIRITITLDHPSIVKTFRADQTTGGVLYMITEYCPGGSMDEWLQNHGPLPADLALSWIVEVAEGLDHAWREQQLVHRDIKPENLLLDAYHHIKIADFGISRRMGAVEQRLTEVGLVVGSVHYMAPEQAVSTEGLDSRADLYALGASFYELLAGVPPINGPTSLAILSQKLGKPSPPLRSRRGGLPSGLTELIDAMLAFRPRDRPADPAEIVERLRAVAVAESIDLERVRARYANG